MPTSLSKESFHGDPVKIAEALLGSIVIHGNTSGRIIETEAYREVGDESCHLFYRKGAREFADRCQPGDAYIYLNYGVHWLLNVLTLDCETGHSGFVLIRALEPIQGIREMKQRRGKDRINELCSGPGKLTQALGIGPTFHEKSLVTGRGLRFATDQKSQEKRPVLADRRIGISKAIELPWRFLVADHGGVSVKASRWSTESSR